ncbi:MAG: DUF4932 domain-containing protein [Candidatus Cloacimonetes bacterium]|jgi:hypothetical protein|nr:DUF4932 domain-containing protein [Candidatus Cloacimonadota bacterium]MCB5287463.1 DUF4932 domain-containing protein [Candidatus Cloacimonadota bacterium]MCK9184895.1 DUF4932 domain-containing protein [Candidatus Cloacimonadota bacterium]MCK9585194.1 DUF4932 domain-containing protein [Candidatus Cloacimonadota bacterium]MDY0229784.1 DUF4932 domain-containing protein [Candidatus Cloacimonadaceae bacterium]
MLYEKLPAVFSEILVCIMCLFPLMLTASMAKSAEYEKIKPLSQTCGKLNITVDPRLELLAVIQYLAGSDMVQADSEGYAAAVDKWFAGVRKHPVLAKYLALEAKGYSYDLPVSCFLRFDGVPLGIQVRTWESYMVSMNLERMTFVDKRGSIEDFYEDVKDFTVKSDFAGFFASQRDFLWGKINAVDSLLAQKPDMIAHMVNWYGYSHYNYTLALSPLLIQNCYGPALVDMKGNTSVYCVLALDGHELSIDTQYYLARIFFHEISHSYVNSLVDAHYEQFARAEALYEPISKKMEAQAYGSWWITVAEHFVQASEIRLQQLYFPAQDHSTAIEARINQGFIYIDNVYAGLLEYEQARRETGIPYDEYFPRLVENFVQLADDPKAAISDRLGFKGPLNSVAMGQIVAIYPDPQRVEGVEENIMPTIDFLIQRLKVEAYTDTQALKLDLKDKNIYVYGAWGSNIWLEKYLDLLPFKILPDRVIADKEYAGTGLRIAACVPHPQNPELGMAVYTGQTTASMKDSNAFFHGPQDWYVSDTNQTVLGQGNFTGKNAVWKF